MTDDGNENDTPITEKSSGCSGCCQRIAAEWRLGMFSLEDTEGNVIDLKETFQPKTSKKKTVLACLKLFQMVWVLWTMYTSFVSGSKDFWLAYLTNWQSIFVLFYFLVSALVFTTILPPIMSQNIEGVDDDDDGVGNASIWTRIAWALYTISLSHALMVTILFWVLVHDPEDGVMYRDIMMHGIFFLLVLVDGMIIQRIPIRLKQLLLTQCVGILYLCWTLIHGFSSIGNPNRNDADPATDDDSIYDSINWKKRPMSSAILSVGIIFIVEPLFHHLFWFLSLLFKPRYYSQTKEDGAIV